MTEPAERDRLLQEFNSPGYRILLCSEVAAEGVDLQFCRVLVNYDLPWNPMRVEQRIGRIDRIGQQAKTIVIVNFHVRGTIDGSIYQHLHRKIGVFNETIGDLEGIVGEHVNRLTLELLSNELTPAQAEEKIRLAGEAIARERAVIAQIDEESETLLGLRSYLQNNVKQGQSLGRYIKASELRLFTIEYFHDMYSGSDSCQLNWDTPVEGCLRLTLSFRAFLDFEVYLNQQVLSWPRGFERESRSVTMTFDPAVHELLRRKHKSLILVNHLHPFVGWMNATYVNRRKVWHPASAVRVASSEFGEDIYFYLVIRVSLKHPVLSKEELLFRALALSTRRILPLDDSEALVNYAIDHGTSWVDYHNFPDCSSALESVWKLLIADCDNIHEVFDEELELRLNSKQAQLESHFRRRLEGAERRIETMRASGVQREQGIRVTQNQMKHLRERLDEERSKLDRSASVAPDFKRVACGIIKTSR
jgi:hypothetical protein